MPAHKLGRRSAPDVRDRAYPMRSVMPSFALRPYRYYKTGSFLPMDQGATGTCVAHAWRGFLLAAPLMCPTPPDAFDLYRRIVLLDEWTDNDHEATSTNNSALQSGTSVRAGVKHLQELGFIESYVWAASAEECARWILTRSTIVMGTNWTSGMDHPDYRTGMAQVTGPSLGGHAWLLTGYNRLTKVFRAMNSWGTLWGREGRFYLSYNDLDKLIKEDGEACAAVEQRVTPLPEGTVIP